MICGASTGGLIAILLGRLRLLVPQAIKRYGELSEYVFSEEKQGWQDGKFKASRLEEAIRNVLTSTLGPGREEERMCRTRGTACKTSVCAVPALHVSNNPPLFRSYICKDPSYNPTIWEAARATSAAPRFFKRIFIGDHGVEEEFIDGALGYNNPAELLIQEAIREYDTESQVGCIVSIGTGKARVAGFKQPKGLFQKAIPSELIAVLVSMATSSEAASNTLGTRYQDCPGLYHRLNVEQGLSAVALREWRKLGEVKTHTLKYLQYPEVNAKIDSVVKSLLGKPERSYRLGSLDGTYRKAPYLESLTGANLFIYPSFGVAHFVDRDKASGEMERCFEAGTTSNDSLSPKTVVLQGMGGCGKSQLALKYCKRAHHGKKYEMVFWIDATSPETVMQNVAQIAEALGKPGFQPSEQEANLRFFLATLNEKIGKWLVVFDNFDNPKLFRRNRIHDYFPSKGPGSILITSRLVQAGAMGYHLEVNMLSKDEAIEVLLHRTKRQFSEENMSGAAEITQRLGYHALAIAQAGAFMKSRGMAFEDYLRSDNKQCAAVLDQCPEIWEYTKVSRDSDEGKRNSTVFTTLELSLQGLSGTSSARRDKGHILTLMAFFDINKLTDALFTVRGNRSRTWLPSCRTDDGWSNFLFSQILSELRNLSLLQSLETTSTVTSFSIHPLVQDWLKARIGREKAKEYIIEAMQVMSWYLQTQDSNNPYDGADLHTRQFMLAHINATILAKQELYNSWGFLKGRDLLEAGYRTLPGNPANLLSYAEAEVLSRKLVKIEAKLYGKKSPGILESLIDLTDILTSQEKYEEAEITSQEAVQVLMRVLGRDHPHTISAYDTQARILRMTGNYSAAIPIYRENLAVSKNVLGADHFMTLGMMNGLVIWLGISGDREHLEEAETLYRESLSLMEKIVGPKHPDTLIVIMNLAANLYKQGRLEDAEALFWRAYAGYESVHGWQYRDAIILLGWMEYCLRDLGKHDEAAKIRKLRKTLEKAEAEQLPESSDA